MVCCGRASRKKFAAVLARPKFAFPPDDIVALIALLRSKGELFEPEHSVAASPDPTDTKFIECARAARADFIITGNKRDFPDAPYGSTDVVGAGDLFDRIAREI